jgi:hypothetical protein
MIFFSGHKAFALIALCHNPAQGCGVVQLSYLRMMVLIWCIGPNIRSNMANKKLTCVKLTTWFTSFITMPNFSDSLLHFKCSPSHSVMAAIGQTKNLSSVSVSSRQRASVVCLCVVTHASYRINTFQSITPRVTTHLCKGKFQFIKTYLSNVELHSTVRSILPGAKSSSNRYVILQFFWSCFSSAASIEWPLLNCED